jgi:DNA-binding GntR family transcriptional regulator
MSATQLAADEIRDLIESGDLESGARIKVDELAAKLGISRTPVRDALQQLKTEGIVDVFPRKGVVVRTISVEEIREVYAIKIAIEPVAASWAAERGNETDREHLESLLDELKRHAASGDVVMCARIVDKLHSQLFLMSSSEVLQEVYRVLRGRVRLLRHRNMGQPGRLDVSVRQHSEIVRSVIDRQAGAAEAAMRRHMTDAAASVENIV